MACLDGWGFQCKDILPNVNSIVLQVVHRVLRAAPPRGDMALFPFLEIVTLEQRFRAWLMKKEDVKLEIKVAIEFDT